MFKYVAILAASAAVVSAEVDPKKIEVETFASTDCSGNSMFHKDLTYGECVEVKNPVNVEKLNNAMFPIIKKSGDHDNEFYLFPNKESCKSYGNKFNSAVEVAFIRAPSRGQCSPCQDCGNVGSVIIRDIDMKVSDKKTKTVEEDSAASATTISATMLAVSTAFAMFF